MGARRFGFSGSPITTTSSELGRSPGKIGETQEQCAQRYGEVTFNKEFTNRTSGLPSERIVRYKKGKIKTEIIFVNDKAEQIMFTGDQEVMSLKKADEVVGVNSQGAKWSQPSAVFKTESIYDSADTDENVIWVRIDGGSAKFTYYNYNGERRFNLTIESPEHSPKQAERIRERFKRSSGEINDTKGF